MTKHLQSCLCNRVFSPITLTLAYTLWHITTWLSSPRKRTIRKKRTDQKWGPGRRDKALGYAINARPGPAKQFRAKTALNHITKHIMIIAFLVCTFHCCAPWNRQNETANFKLLSVVQWSNWRIKLVLSHYLGKGAWRKSLADVLDCSAFWRLNLVWINIFLILTNIFTDIKSPSTY